MGKVIKPDIEGLTLDGRGRLIASFERQPRVKMLARDGRLVKNIEIPKFLRKRSIFRGRNKMFEAICYHHKYGILVASEYPKSRE